MPIIIGYEAGDYLYFVKSRQNRPPITVETLSNTPGFTSMGPPFLKSWLSEISPTDLLQSSPASRYFSKPRKFGALGSVTARMCVPLC